MNYPTYCIVDKTGLTYGFTYYNFTVKYVHMYIFKWRLEIAAKAR